MKKIVFLFTMLWLGCVLGANAQGELPLNAPKNEFKVINKSQAYLKVSLSLSSMKTLLVSTPQGNFTDLVLDGFSRIYDAGRPQLPVFNKLIEIPYGADIEVNLISFDEEIIPLSLNGLPNKVMPCQPSLSKSTDPSEVPFYYDQLYYLQDQFNTTPVASVQTKGIMRGVQMGELTLAPIRYNPLRNTLKVYNNLVVEIRFNNADFALTEQNKSKYYSPAFEGAYGQMINFTPPATKDLITEYPIKYVIISLTSFQTTLQPFVQWKTKKGFTVVEQYYASAPTTTTVKNYLQGLYTAGTTQDPAPTFVLFVGDVAQIPAYTGTTGTHPTDLYYCCYDGGSDYIPELYYGRFSATNTTQLSVQINKTLQYEQYTMPVKTYLDTVVMVAGADGTFATVWANGQINYGTSNYFNSAHGMYSYTHLYPASQTQDAVIRTEIGKGVGYANYTAHCSSTGWADPSFSTSDIPAMVNQDKYGLLVGNCCLSNKFNDTECFGEAMLRTANKGAVGYLGASNNSLWDEDYYWAVGNRASIVQNPTYDANNLGAYDGMFHDHGEAKSKWYIYNGAMKHAGNLAVEASSSSENVYYWEIYHLMGDPSVMTYFSVPDPLTVNYVNPQIVGVTTLQVNTEEDAYVAISDDGVLLNAQLAPVGGVVTLTFPAFTVPDTADIVITKQNKQPYIGTVRFVQPSIPLDASISAIAVPESNYNCAGLQVNPQVTLTNMGTSTLNSCTILYNIDGGANSSYVWNGTLASMASTSVNLPAITLTAGNHIFNATSSLPNGNPDQNTSNDASSKDYEVQQLTLSAEFSAAQTAYCSAPANVSFTNNSSNGLTYLWDFGDGNTSTDENPLHTYTNLGTYTVTLTASAGVCGSDAETKTAYITIGATPPATTNASHCGPGSVTLTATGTGTMSWYDALTGGTLQFTGNNFTTPSLSTTTTYYVQAEAVASPLSAGKPDNSGGGGNLTNQNQWLIFDCYESCTLVSVSVYASVTGNRTFQLRNSAGTGLAEATVNITSTSGAFTVPLNFTIPVGTDMQLGLKSTSTCNLYRNNAGVTFPYTTPGYVSITNSSAGTDYYYYLYNWVIQPNNCTSARTPATAFILASAPVASYTFSPSGYLVSFTNTSSNGVSYFWDFGDGATSTGMNPSHTYSTNGLYNVMLVVTNDCGSDTTWQNVDLTTVSIEEQGASPISVYPNPSQGFVTLMLNDIKADKIELFDLTGRLLTTVTNARSQVSFDLRTWGAGVYYFRVTAEDQTYNCKFTNLD